MDFVGEVENDDPYFDECVPEVEPATFDILKNELELGKVEPLG